MKHKKLLSGMLIIIVLIFVAILVSQVKKTTIEGGQETTDNNVETNADVDMSAEEKELEDDIVWEDEEPLENSGVWADETLWADAEPEVDEEMDKYEEPEWSEELGESDNAGEVQDDKRNEDPEMEPNVGEPQQEGTVQQSGESLNVGDASQSRASAKAEDVTLLNNVYGTVTLSQGDIHGHVDNDGKIDETKALEQWKKDLPGLELDFVASLDHRQTSHFENSSWNRNVFLYGTEAETSIQGKKKTGASGILHYNMLFAGNNAATMLRKTLSSAGVLKSNGKDYEYAYNRTDAWFGDLIKTVQNNGGFFVIPHPNQKRGSAPYAANALGYVFEDSKGKVVNRIGFEVLTRSAYDAETEKNYEYWKQLLKAGYKYYACAGSDIHGLSSEKGGDGNPLIKKAITSIYTKASEKNDQGYLKQLIKGNFTAGAVGIKMCVGETPMGGECDFKGKRLVVQIGEFYNYLNANARYRVEIHTEDGLKYQEIIKPSDYNVFAYEADERAKYYRVEVRYEESNTCVAYGNPIWNTSEKK